MRVPWENVNWEQEIFEDAHPHHQISVAFLQHFPPNYFVGTSLWTSPLRLLIGSLGSTFQQEFSDPVSVGGKLRLHAQYFSAGGVSQQLTYLPSLPSESLRLNLMLCLQA